MTPVTDWKGELEMPMFCQGCRCTEVMGQKCVTIFPWLIGKDVIVIDSLVCVRLFGRVSMLEVALLCFGFWQLRE